MVGFGDMLQQTPLAVTSAPPSKVTFPPLDAVFDVIAETAVVLTVGVVGVFIAVHVPDPDALQ